MLKVECVEILEGPTRKTKDGGKAEEAVKTQNEGKVRNEDTIDIALCGHGGNHGRQAVVAHEGINGNAKEAGQALDRGHFHAGWGRRLNGRVKGLGTGETHDGDDDHHHKGGPAQEGRHQLDPLGFFGR